MEGGRRLGVAIGATVALFLGVQLGALALVDPFLSAGYQAVEDPSDPANSVAYVLAILVMTGVILVIVKLGAKRFLRAAVTVMSGFLSFYVFSVVVPPTFVVDGINVGAWLFAGALTLALYVYPEWYVIDLAGVVIGAAGAGLFGISFGPLPAIVLLGLLAVYDAIAVYRTEHMLTLAESVTDLKLPLVLVIPLSLSYSFLEEEGVDTEGEDPEERDAFFIGLGDTVMPTIMVASAAFFSGAPSLGVPGLALNLPALLAMIGTLIGLGVLLYLVLKGRPHAGLPLLNGGAIGGYLLGAVLAGIPVVEAVGIAPYM